MKIKNFSLLLGALASALGFFRTPTLGANYNTVNATTYANLTAQNSKIVEELWTRMVVEGADYQYQDNPFADGFMGEGDGGKTVVKITDTEKVAGNTINVTTIGGFGGPGLQGSTARDGQEEKIQIGSFPVKIGRFWTGVGFQAVARDETMIGGRLDSIIVEGLRYKHARKRNDDMIRLLIAQGNTSSRNKFFPVGSGGTRATLKTANYVDTPTITSVREVASSNGCLPMALGPKDSGGSRPECFTFFGTHLALAHLNYETAYLQGLQYAAARGDTNPIFKGNYAEWSGIGIYRWFQKDHGNWGPVGSLLAPRLFLGRAMTGATYASGSTANTEYAITSTDVITGAATMQMLGGGNAVAAAVSPQPEYTTYFSNAPWTYHNGNTIAADTSTARYVLMIHPTNGTWGLFRYTLNSGVYITLTHRRVLGLTGETADWAAFPIGSLVVEANLLGTPVGSSLLLGREALIAGVGSINGKKSNPQMGNRTTYEGPHGMDFGVGAEAVWGAAVVTRADSVAPGFVVIESAVPTNGAPTVT